MEDREIIALFFDRDEGAIRETAKKYGSYLFMVAVRIVEKNEDAEECVSDTYLDAWNTIPPTKPNYLKLFLAKLARNRALHVYRAAHAKKRDNHTVDAVLDELTECLSGGVEPEREADKQELSRAISIFLEKQRKVERGMFLRRYFYGESVKEIAMRYGLSENKISVSLHRMRAKLKKHLEAEGVHV